ncbi:LPO_1073/Vpar_1526 family protein [Rhodanobacter soli]
MTNEKIEQSQDVGRNAIAIQASGDVTISSGISYGEARQIAVDVIASEFSKLAGVARDVAQARVEEIRNEFFQKLEKDHPAGVGQATDVDFQHDLFLVQRDYARTGDKDLGALLVDLLVDRSKESTRNMKQIVLNESIVTAPKLTQSQIAALGLIFLLRYSRNAMVNRVDRITEYLDQFARPLAVGFEVKDSSFQHLDFAGCGTIAMTSITLEQIFIRTYKGIFTDGFEKKELEQNPLKEKLAEFVCPALRDPDRLQVAFVSDEVLDEKIKQRVLLEPIASELKRLFGLGLFGEDRVREDVVEKAPYMRAVFNAWSKTSMQNFQLTSVGIAIGHASVKRYAGEFADLSIWVD